LKKILITGGAGYIGSHVLRLLSQNKNYDLTVIDSLEKGFKQAVDIISSESQNTIKFIQMDLRNINDFDRLDNQKFDATLHFAAFILVGDSVEKPIKYFENNVSGSINLLKYLNESNSKNLVFSSTSALYSKRATPPFTEESLVEPENPYAESKYTTEKIINWMNESHGFRSIILRYFNPCGCSLDGKIGYSLIPSLHLFPNVVRGALGQQPFTVTCGKVNTADGTTIRDYFNVLDLAAAHKIALEALLEGKAGGTYNVGTGKGHSVKEIIDIVKKITGVEFKIEPGMQRPGELPEVYCDPSRFKNEFNWEPKYTLEQAVESLVKWFKKHPNGYNY